MLIKSSFLTFLIVVAQGWTPTNRLQNDAIPSSYTLKLVPNVTDDTFSGEVSIFIEIAHSIRNITLNIKNLEITDITLDQAFRLTDFKIDADNELLHVCYKDQSYIDPGEHLLHIKFNGSLAGNSYGLYSSTFTTNGIESKIIASKFSPIYAREAFPCFDEPSFKSIFNIRLIKPDDTWTALSNLEEIGSFKTPQGIAVDFQSTPLMSTYLLAFILTTFSYDELFYQTNHRNIPLRFFSYENDSVVRKNALENTRKVLQYYEEYTGIPYQLPKLDFIEIPDYRSRGMEHWGLITYQQYTIIPFPYSFGSQLYNSIDSMALIAHEVSHMWFGNLVTHQWYHNIWLTEGFARFMQYKAIHRILKEPFVKMLFQKNKCLSLIEMHCKGSVLTETSSFVRSLEDIKFKFGAISYDQGAAILTMLEDVIGPENFNKAVRIYLKDHAYGDVTTNDFISTVQKIVPTTNIRYFMETYLFQKNVPLILVSEDTDNYILKQDALCKRYGDSIFGYRWTVPIKYITSSNQTGKLIWFNQDSAYITIPKQPNDRWIKINHKNLGLYRALYSGKIYEALQKDFKQLSTYDQASLLEETFLLTGKEKLSCNVPLLLLGEFKNSSGIDFLTFTYASRSFTIFRKKTMFDTDTSDMLKLYFIHIFESLYHKIKWISQEGESLDERLLKIAVLESFCLSDINYDDCYRNAENIKKQNKTIHNDLEYIYKSLLNHPKLLKAPVKRTVIPVEVLVPSNPPNHIVDECELWIKENLPSILNITSNNINKSAL